MANDAPLFALLRSRSSLAPGQKKKSNSTQFFSFASPLLSPRRPTSLFSPHASQEAPLQYRSDPEVANFRKPRCPVSPSPRRCRVSLPLLAAECLLAPPRPLQLRPPLLLLPLRPRRPRPPSRRPPRPRPAAPSPPPRPSPPSSPQQPPPRPPSPARPRCPKTPCWSSAALAP